MPPLLELRRLLLGMLVMLSVVTLVAASYAIIGPDTLLTRDDNPRLVEAIAAIDRGDIFDRDGRLLVTSMPSDSGRRMTRRYLDPAIYGTAGYYSLRYGEAGAEAAYNVILSGADQPYDLGTYLKEDVLHQPRQGHDVRLTLDLSAQQALVRSLDEVGCTIYAADASSDRAVQGCAGVVLSVPDGGVLAMASLPTYDPNQLGSQWNDLVQNSAQPFFNRPLQGNYQPGTISQLILLTVARIKQVDPQIVYPNATDVVRVGQVAQACLTSPPHESLTLDQALIFGCPAPYAQMVNSLGLETITQTLSLFLVDGVPVLPGYLPDDLLQAEATPMLQGNVLALDDVMGQGTMTMTPLQMASIIAAYINAGNGVYPHILMGTRQSGNSEWTAIDGSNRTMPITTPEIVRQVRDSMRDAIVNGIAQSAGHHMEGYDLGGLVGLANAGPTTQVWFVGWAREGSRNGVVAVILLENSNDFDAAARAGGDVLVAALEARRDDAKTVSEEHAGES